MHSRRTLHSIATVLIAVTMTAEAQNTNYAQRIACDMDDPASGLIDLHWLQGAAPILEITPTRGTARIAAQTNVTVELIFSQTPTNALFVKTNAYLASGTSYWMQFGTIGTNSCDDGETIIPSPWWYTILFSNAGGVYWSGNGRLYVHPTTATGTNGVTWQEWEAGAAKDDVAREWIRQLSNVVENIEVGDIHYGTAYTNVYRGSWGDFASNLAATAYGWGNHALAGYITNGQTGATLFGDGAGWTNVDAKTVGGYGPNDLPYLSNTQTAETYPQTISFADGYASFHSTGQWIQVHAAAQTETCRFVRAAASLTNAASLVCLLAANGQTVYFQTNNLLGFTTNGIAASGATNTIFLDSAAGSTNWNWKLLH